MSGSGKICHESLKHGISYSMKHDVGDYPLYLIKP